MEGKERKEGENEEGVSEVICGNRNCLLWKFYCQSQKIEKKMSGWNEDIFSQWLYCKKKKKKKKGSLSHFANSLS